MAVTAPTGNVYAFDPAMFTITAASGMYTLTIAGVPVVLSAFSSTISYNASLLLRGLFPLSTLSAGTSQRTVSWTLTQNGNTVGSGSFTAIYGTNRFKDITSFTLRWYGRNGSLVQQDFCKAEEVITREDEATVRTNGIDTLIDYNRVRSFELYIADVSQTDYRNYTSIIESPVVQLLDGSSWANVSVPNIDYVLNRQGSKDFHVIIVMPYD